MSLERSPRASLVFARWIHIVPPRKRRSPAEVLSFHESAGRLARHIRPDHSSKHPRKRSQSASHFHFATSTDQTTFALRPERRSEPAGGHPAWRRALASVNQDHSETPENIAR